VSFVTEIVIYTAKDGHVELDVRLTDETVWLSMSQMVELFGRDKSIISRHLNNIFKVNELERETTVAKYTTVQKEGNREVKRKVEYYNLDAIISVGYRVNSKEGVQFRKWAAQVLKAHLIRGYIQPVTSDCLKEVCVNCSKLLVCYKRRWYTMRWSMILVKRQFS
jgi:DNA ligase (NAD+)